MASEARRRKMQRVRFTTSSVSVLYLKMQKILSKFCLGNRVPFVNDELCEQGWEDDVGSYDD